MCEKNYENKGTTVKDIMTTIYDIVKAVKAVDVTQTTVANWMAIGALKDEQGE
jgi:hypothetical protein